MDEEQNISGIEGKEKNSDVQVAVDKAKQETVKVGKKVAKDTAKNVAKEASKKAAMEASKNAGSASLLVPPMLYVVIIVIILLILLGSFIALKTMPSAFTNTVSKYVEGTFQTVLDLFKSNEAKFSKDSVKRMHNTASYLRDHGTNLYADGYIFEKVDQKDSLKKVDKNQAEGEEISDEDYKYDGSDLTEEDRFVPEEGIYVDKEGKVKYMKYEGSPLFYYVWMNGYTYMVDDQHGNFWSDLRSAVNGFLEFMGRLLISNVMIDDGSNSFPGMIYIDIENANIFRDIKNYFVPPKVEVDLDKNVLTIRNRGTANNITLSYNLEGWSGRYGIPINFIYALHDSSMAPDLIIELIKGTKYENNKYRKTKMNMIGDDHKVTRRLKFVSSGVLANPGEYTPEEIREVTKEEMNKVLQENPLIDVPPNIGNYKRVRVKVPVENNNNSYFLNQGIVLGYKRVTPEEVNATFKERDVEKIKNGEYYNSKDVEANVGPDYGEAMALIDKKFGKSFWSKIKGAFTGGTESTEYVYLLRIKEVVDHWFRDVYFQMPKGTKYLKYDTDYLIKTGELWTKMKEDVNKDSDKRRTAEVQETESDWSAYDNPDTPEDESDKKNLEGEEHVLRSDLVTKEMFDKVLEESSEADKNELKDALSLLENNLYIELLSKAEPVKQYQDARRGITNQRLIDIFNQKWYIYDGTEKTANAINKDRRIEIEQYGTVTDSYESKYKKKIDPKVVLPEVADTLRRSGDIDSEFIYKDIKELLVELGYNRDKLRDPIRPVLQWVLKKAKPGKSFPSGYAAKDETEHGIRILSEEAVKSLYYTEALSQEQAALDNKKIQIENKKRAAYAEKDEKKRETLYGEIPPLEEEYEKGKLDFITKKQELLEKYGTKSQIENELKDFDKKILNAKTEEERKKLEEFRKAAKEAEGKISEESNIDKDSDEAKQKEKEDKEKEKNDPIIKKVRSRYGKGYKEDDFVLSPVTGKLKYIPEDNCVEITALTKDDLESVPEGYKEFYETEYKGTIEGYKIRIYNVEEVTSEEKGNYKRQIPKRLIRKLSTKEEQEKVENSEKLKKEAPDREGDYVKEGAVIAKPIMDTEVIKEANEKAKNKNNEEDEKLESEQSEEDKKKFGGLNKLAKKKQLAGADAEKLLKADDIGDAPYIRMTMLDTDNAVVDRLPEYMQKRSGGGFEIEISDDYDTRGYGGEVDLDDIKNCLDPDDPASIDILKEIIATKFTDPRLAFNKDPQAFLDAQKETGVNAFFTICVSIVETSGGTNFGVIDKNSNNIFCIKNNDGSWRHFDSLKDAVTQFAELISKKGPYWKNDKYTVREIGPTYCERVADPTDQWEDRVMKWWTELMENAQELGY